MLLARGAAEATLAQHVQHHGTDCAPALGFPDANCALVGRVAGLAKSLLRCGPTRHEAGAWP
eukprot:scaffold3208_cov402-Prasinococcus_capsulatus_cf.AAC.6